MFPLASISSPHVLDVDLCAPEVVVSEKPVVKPRVWPVFTAWLLALVAGQAAVLVVCFTMGMVMGLYLGAQGVDSATISVEVQKVFAYPVVSLIAMLLPVQLTMLAIAFFAARRSQEPVRERLGLVPQAGRPFGALGLTTMAGFTLSVALGVAITFLLLTGTVAADPISGAANDESWLVVVLSAVMVGLIPAFIEETLFRGYMQRRLLERWSPKVAIATSTLLFAVIHMDSLQHILAVIPLGLVCGMLAYRSKSVLPGMLVHLVHNLGAVGFSVLIRVLAPIMTEDALGYTLIGTLVMLALIGLPAVVMLFLRDRKVATSAVETLAVPTAPMMTRNAELEFLLTDSRTIAA